jgi:transcriptional regulator with XRE-family HTH domain
MQTSVDLLHRQAYRALVARTFGSNLRRIREQRRITQEELMRRLGLKRPAPISLWESRDAIPRPDTIVRLAAALGCSARELLEDVETPYDRLRAGKNLLQRARGPSEPLTVTSKRASSA